MTEASSWTPDELKDLSDAGIAAFLATMDGNADAASDAIEHVADTYGTHGVYALCCGWANMVQQIAFPNVTPSTGDIAFVEMLDGYDPTNQGDLFAARFVACTLNDDGLTRAALFFAPINAGDPERAAANVSSLVGMAASFGTMRQEGRV